MEAFIVGLRSLEGEVSIGYWAAHEQYSPSKLLEFAIAAEKSGFESVMASDHFMPWFDSRASGGFAWSWATARAASTKEIEIGTGVTAPDRYHPAIIAQGFATMDEMYPGRFLLGLGAGEALNSIPLGLVFPSPGQRVERLKDALEIITRLWSGKYEDYSGFYQLHNAKLYTAPKSKIPIYVAAGGQHSAKIAGKYADGVIGFSGSNDVFKVAQESASEHGRGTLGRMIEFKCSYDPDYDKALESIKIWRSAMVPHVLDSDIHDPRTLEKKGREEVSEEDIKKTWTIVTNVEDLIRPIEELERKGLTRIQVHSSSPDEQRFIHDFGNRSLLALRRNTS